MKGQKDGKKKGSGWKETKRWKDKQMVKGLDKKGQGKRWKDKTQGDHSFGLNPFHILVYLYFVVQPWTPMVTIFNPHFDYIEIQ